MSMITGCPACGTMFKVVPDQLKISDGWVRCGHCSEVFDAPAHMVPAAALREAGVLAPADVPEESVQQDSPTTEGGPAASAVPPVPQETPAIDVSALLQQEAEPPALPPAPVEEDPVPPPQDSRAMLPAVIADASQPPVPDDVPIELEDVGFIRKARRQAFWSRPAVRILLLLVIISLAALLTAQVAVEERDRLAATQPELRPWLERLCEPLACRIGPPRRIESIAIDSSTFSKLRADTYRLSLTLKNQAPQPVALPAIELTLTDAQDQPVLRRVLQPRELGAGADTMPSGSEWSASAAIAVGGGTGGRIAGYRVLAFYP